MLHDVPAMAVCEKRTWEFYSYNSAWEVGRRYTARDVVDSAIAVTPPLNAKQTWNVIIFIRRARMGSNKITSDVLKNLQCRVLYLEIFVVSFVPWSY